jgi:hypothetical protein
MVRNPTTDEIRDIGQHLAAQCDNDVYRIGAEIRRRQAASTRRNVRLPKRPPATATAANEPIHASGENGSS